jgi:bile acid transporter
MDGASAVNLFMLFLLMLGLGLAVNVERFQENFAKPKGVTIGVICQFLLMPPSAYVMSGIMGLSSLYRIALVLIGCCPGGAMSNILCFLFQADLDLSVAMTTASSFCAIFMMPLNIYLYVNVTGLSDDVSLDYFGIVLSALLVVAGLGGGISIKKWAPTSPKGPMVTNIVGKLGAIGGLGVFITGLIANSQSDTPIWGATGGIYGSASCQVLLGIAMGFGIASVAGLPKPSCVAVSVETSVQNAVLAMAIIAISFDEDEAAEAAVVPMCYMMFSTWTNVIWCIVSWKVFEFTNLSRNATFKEVIQAYKDSMAVEDKDGEIAGINDGASDSAL